MIGSPDELSDTPIYSDEEDQLRRGGIARIAAPGATTGLPPVTARGLGPVTPAASPAAGSTEDLEARGSASRIAPLPIAKPSALDTRKAADEAELGRLQGTGSGISQIKNPIARGALRGLETIGNVLVPRTTAMIPGTEGHHNQLLGQARGRIGEDLNEEEKTAQTAKAGADTDEATARAEHERAAAEAARNPKTGLTPEETTIHDLMTGENGQPRINPDTQQPFTYFEAYQKVMQAKQDVRPDKTPNFEEQTYNEWKTAHPNGTRMEFDKERKANERAPEKEPKQLIVGPDGTVMELKAGMKVPVGSKTVAGDFAGVKPNAEELKRSEMAENMGENLDKLEDIVKRRPDLFGPAAGRITEGKMWLGSNDPDIGALNTIKDQIGMAQQSAHSMRSAQHVEAAAASILNGFKNGPDAINSSIKTARDSLKTFTKDVQQGNPSTRKEGGGGSGGGGKIVSLADARKLEANKGKTDDEIRADIKAHGYTVKED